MKLLKTYTDAPLGAAFAIQDVGGLLACLAVTLGLACLMMLTYRLCHDSLTYNRKFNITLMMLAFVSTVLLALIQNSPLLSLGVLGSLSICRIRTNTRDPRDLGFVFWSLAIGISSALGAFLVGLACTLLLSGVMLVLRDGRAKKDTITMVVRGQKEWLASVQEVFEERPGSRIQCKNLFPDSFELVYKMKAPKVEAERLLGILSGMDGVHGVNVLAPKTQVA